ncbi:hypothetical protein Daura_37655 [Dactylosporangium aurantiacum]|uniref:Uncharacterized protein n=1 Tax=Dactylosporangium aurantiacum TaxID=35754 RepID=A0A9Q9MF95_9ACTN|nr:hypothetical protein [Dactylosporangium aurantiacum]MDG6101855.1 hypothetical protein [Dactylosporangium aurantiacum]UWZ52345.1 hypothetical protein Daura_37655 [Dactylosporangium aurantiacum]
MSTPVMTGPSTTTRPELATGACLVVGGIAFIAGGATHPGDSGEGSKVQQLHEMLVQPSWYPSHALLLAAIALFTAGFFLVSRRPGLPARMRAVTRAVAWVGVLATAGMTAHLFAALEADALAGGEPTTVSTVQTWNETVVDSLWALSIAVLAVAGGLTRTVGNRLTLVLGLVGGVAFGLASATIAFTDRFDGLFPAGSLIGIWAAAVGVLTVVRR